MTAKNSQTNMANPKPLILLSKNKAILYDIPEKIKLKNTPINSKFPKSYKNNQDCRYWL